MSPPNTCPDCGLTITGNQPKGLCSRCALNELVGLESASLPHTDEQEQLATVPACSIEKKLGKYELVREIARGGMGIVYEARQEGPTRTVALKLMLFGSHATPELIRRFRLEASAAAVLHHPNIVEIYEVGVAEGEHFIAMEYVDGPNLSVLARTRPLSSRQIGEYLRSVSLAIDHAHSQGILHRDLKPSNVLIDSQGHPRVTDFGLAKKLTTLNSGETSQEEGDGLDSNWLDYESLTASGQVLGSPGFMSPEQARGLKGKVDQRSDIYSLGSMLYYLLTGRAPFGGGGSLADTLRQVETQEPVTPRLLNPGVPTDLETICLKCLEKDPHRRYQTAQSLADDFERFLQGKRVSARPIGSIGKLHRWTRRNRMASAFIATVCCAFLSALWLLVLVNQEKNKQSVLVAEVTRTVHANGALLQRTLARLDENLEGIWANRDKPYIDLDSEDVAMMGGQTKPAVTNRTTSVRWKMGLITDEYPAQRVRQHTKLLSELESRTSKSLGQEVRIDVRLYKFHEDFVKDLVSGVVDFGRMGAVRYLRTHRAHPEITPLVIPKSCNKIGLLFTRTNSGIRSLSDVVGRRVAFGDTNSTISFWAQIKMAENGLTGDRLLSHEFLDSTLDFADEVMEVGFSNAVHRIGYLHSHAAVVEGVIDGRFDVGVAMRRALLIQQSRGLVAIPGTEFSSSPNIQVARPGLAQRHLGALVHAMTNLQGRWLEALPDQTTGYIPAGPEVYQKETAWLQRMERTFPAIVHAKAK